MVELNLTKRQQEIFDYIRRYGAEHGYPPTVRDIGKAIGLTSSSTVHAHLANLEKVGLLRRDPTKPRALEILVDKAKQVVSPSGLPIVGQVAAGEPMLAEENIEEYVPVPTIAGGDEGEFLLRVKGDSMKNVGILEGDHVVVRRQDTASDGEIVVALVDEEATVKRFFKEKDHVRLQPENEALEPILVRDVEVLGRVVGVCRRVVMTPALLDSPRPPSRAPSAARAAAGRELTLEQRLGATLAAAEAGQPADCPVCRGSMIAAGGGGRLRRLRLARELRHGTVRRAHAGLSGRRSWLPEGA